MPRFKVHKGGLAQDPDPVRSVTADPPGGLRRKLVVEEAGSEVWCFVTYDRNEMDAILPKIVGDEGVWLKPDGEDAFLVTAKGHEPGYVTENVAELTPRSHREFAFAYLEFMSAEIKLGRAEKWK